MSRLAVVTIFFALILAACAPAAPEPTATPAATDTPTETLTATLSPTRSVPTLPPEPTDTPTLTPSITNTHVTATFIPTRTNLPTRTLTFTPSLTNTPTFTDTLTPTNTPTATHTHTPTPSLTPTLSFTPQANAVVAQRTPAALLPFGARFRYVAVGPRHGFLDLSRGDVYAWAWDFGDGATSTWRSPNHVYAEPGLYVVRLTVYGPDGVSVSARTIEAKPYSCTVAPRGRVRIRATPSDSALAIYLMLPEQRGTTSFAMLDADGRLWYKLDGGGWSEAWLRAEQVNILAGRCPEP